MQTCPIQIFPINMTPEVRLLHSAGIMLQSYFEGAGYVQLYITLTKVNIPCPQIIASYNQFTGDMELMRRVMSQ